MNTEQLARYLTALEAIATNTGRIAAVAEAWAKPIRLIVPDDVTPTQNELRAALGFSPAPDTEDLNPKGPYA